MFFLESVRLTMNEIPFCRATAQISRIEAVLFKQQGRTRTSDTARARSISAGWCRIRGVAGALLHADAPNAERSQIPLNAMHPLPSYAVGFAFHKELIEDSAFAANVIPRNCLTRAFLIDIAFHSKVGFLPPLSSRAGTLFGTGCIVSYDPIHQMYSIIFRRPREQKHGNH
jgi:hypothetical protein